MSDNTNHGQYPKAWNDAESSDPRVAVRFCAFFVSECVNRLHGTPDPKLPRYGLTPSHMAQLAASHAACAVRIARRIR